MQYANTGGAPRKLFWPAGVDLHHDYINGRYFDAQALALADAGLTDTHATDILALGSGGYETIAPNVLARTDLGLLTTVDGTNKCENWNANPTDLSGLFGTAVGDGRVSVVDDAAELAAAGLSSICTSDKVYKIDNSASGSDTAVTIGGSTGNLNAHIGSCWGRVIGGASPSRLFCSGGSGSADWPIGGSYTRVSGVFTPSGTSAVVGVLARAGAVVYFILNQLEESSFATDPIITDGQSRSRNGNQLVIDLTGRLSEGVSGVIAVNVLGAESDARILNINDNTEDNRIALDISSGSMRLVVISGGTASTVLTYDSYSPGMRYIAFAVSNNFARVRFVGGTEQADNTVVLPSVSLAGIGCRAEAATSNAYQRTERLALKTGPQDQASFDAMYALAQEWAAQ